jgi:hypothetical protein
MSDDKDNVTLPIKGESTITDFIPPVLQSQVCTLALPRESLPSLKRRSQRVIHLIVFEMGCAPEPCDVCTRLGSDRRSLRSASHRRRNGAVAFGEAVSRVMYPRGPSQRNARETVKSCEKKTGMANLTCRGRVSEHSCRFRSANYEQERISTFQSSCRPGCRCFPPSLQYRDA